MTTGKAGFALSRFVDDYVRRRRHLEHGIVRILFDGEHAQNAFESYTGDEEKDFCLILAASGVFSEAEAAAAATKIFNALDMRTMLTLRNLPSGHFGDAFKCLAYVQGICGATTVDDGSGLSATQACTAARSLMLVKLNSKRAAKLAAQKQ